MGPSSGQLPRSGQGTAALSCPTLGHLLGVSVGSRDGFSPCLRFGAAAVLRAAGSSVPLARKTGWVAWHGMASMGEASWPSWSLGLDSSGGLPPSPWPIPG